MGRGDGELQATGTLWGCGMKPRREGALPRVAAEPQEESAVNPESGRSPWPEPPTTKCSANWHSMWGSGRSTQHPEHRSTTGPELSLQGGGSEVSVTAALPGIRGLAG